MLARDLSLALDPVGLMNAMGFQPDPWQASILRSPARRALLLCTRQAGKSTVTGAIALHEAIYRAPALVLLLSPSLRQSSELFRKVADYFQALGAPVGTKEASALRLELENGSRIISLPGKEETIRGFSGVRLLVVDEAARVPDSVYYATRPFLAVSGGRMVALSTPFGKRGWFHKEWTEGGEGWERVRVTAPDCPRISPDFLEEERRSLGEWWFKQEYMCEFVETSDQVFSFDAVQAALTDEVKPLFGAKP
jgi:hypothetical protein